MLGMKRSHLQPIGLDLGAASIKMLQLEVSGDALHVVAAASRAYDDRMTTDHSAQSGMAGAIDSRWRLDQAGDIIADLLQEHPFHGRGVVAALPRGIVHVKNLRLPQIPPDELAQAVQFEAGNIFPFKADDAIVHFLPAGMVRQGAESRQEVIVVAALKSEVDTYLERIHNWGLQVQALDVEMSAIYRCIDRFIRRREDEQLVHVLVDVGARQSTVVIGRGREIHFVKQVDLGVMMLDEAISRKLSLSMTEASALRCRMGQTAIADDASQQRDPVRQAVFDAMRPVSTELAREISLCLRYYSVTFRGHRPERVSIAGGGGCDQQLLAQLNSGLPIPAEMSRPLNNIDCSQVSNIDRSQPLSSWTIATGLALRFVPGGFMPLDGRPRSAGMPPSVDDEADATLPGTAEGVDDTTRDLPASGTTAPAENMSSIDARGKSLPEKSAFRTNASAGDAATLSAASIINGMGHARQEDTHA